MENRKYALYTFLTLMIELSIASVMYLLVVKLQTSYLFISDALWHYGILKVICVTAALFLYFIIKCYYKGRALLGFFLLAGSLAYFPSLVIALNYKIEE